MYGLTNELNDVWFRLNTHEVSGINFKKNEFVMSQNRESVSVNKLFHA